MTARFFFRQTLVLALFCAVGIASAKDTRMLIDQVPPDPLFKPQTPLTANSYPDQQAEMKQAVERLLKTKYRVLAEHFYLYPSEEAPTWVALKPSIGNFIFEKLKGKTEYENSGSAPDPSIAIWKVGVLHPQRIALAMSEIPDGNALVGYFEVEKE